MNTPLLFLGLTATAVVASTSPEPELALRITSTVVYGFITVLISGVFTLFQRNLGQQIKQVHLAIAAHTELMAVQVNSQDRLTRQTTDTMEKSIGDVTKEVRGLKSEYRNEIAIVREDITNIKATYTLKEDFKEHKKELFLAVKIAEMQQAT